jgi:hypothetical protein
MAITLQYVDSNGATQSNTYARPLLNPGIDDADEVAFYPEVNIQRLAGGNYFTLPPQVANRVITVDFGIIPNQSDRIFIFNFFFQKNASGVCEDYIVYNGETIRVDFDRRDLKFNWINNVQYQKALILKLYEKTSWSSMPASWTALTIVTGVPQPIAGGKANLVNSVFGGAMVLAYGICWKESANPTIADSHTVDGSGEGNFNSQMTGLVDYHTYYVKAYATTATGTFYGNQQTLFYDS